MNMDDLKKEVSEFFKENPNCMTKLTKLPDPYTPEQERDLEYFRTQLLKQLERDKDVTTTQSSGDPQ